MAEHPTPRKRRDKLLQILQDGQVHQAANLAAKLAISQRSLYRDIQQLQQSGIPIKGRPGQGYKLAPAHYLPAMALSPEELEALHLGLAILCEGANGILSSAATTLGAKIDAALETSTDSATVEFAKLVPNHGPLSHVATLRSAISARQLVEVHTDGQVQIARPLFLRFEGRDWRVVLYSETISTFLSLSIGEMTTVTALPELFTDSPGKTLDDFRSRSFG